MSVECSHCMNVYLCHTHSHTDLICRCLCECVRVYREDSYKKCVRENLRKEEIWQELNE